MLHGLVEGVTRALDDAYLGRYPVRTDGLEQNAQDGIFFVKLLNPVAQTQAAWATRVRCPFVVAYFPEVVGDGQQADLAAKEFDLMLALRWIVLNDGAKKIGHDVHAHVQDGVLQVFVSYDLHLRAKEEEKVLVQQLQQYGRVKGAE